MKGETKFRIVNEIHKQSACFIYKIFLRIIYKYRQAYLPCRQGRYY